MGYSPIKTIQQCSFSRSILRYLFWEQIFSPTNFFPKLQHLNWNTYRRNKYAYHAKLQRISNMYHLFCSYQTAQIKDAAILFGK